MNVSASSERRAAREEATFFDWVRHYGAMIAVFLIGGIVAGLLSAGLSKDAEVTTLVVYQGGAIPAREFGVVGGAVFRSDATLRPAMENLGISTSTSQFLEESVQLRPVPDAGILIVVGRAPEEARAAEISWTTAEALRASLVDSGLDGFTLLPGGNTPGTLATRVLVALGALSGGLLGLAVAIVHYRARRPTMSLRRAFDLVDPQSVALLEGRASWLGALRTRPWLRKRGRNDITLSRLAVREPMASLVIAGGAGHRERASLKRLVDGLSRRGASVDTQVGIRSEDRADELSFPSPPATKPTLLLADARTRERDLLLEASGPTGREIHLLWIR